MSHPLMWPAEEEVAVMKVSKPAIAFLEKHGHTSLVSLGCGHQLNRIDNHIRLMAALNLTYYVAIDRQIEIKPVSPDVFLDPDGMTALLTKYYRGEPRKFWKAVRVFPGTWVEELNGVHCAVVVCQRVLPHCRWEDVLFSMTPKLVLQEDIHGCERQQLRGREYVRTWSEKHHYGLQPFQPWRIFPGEYNLILWRRRDFAGDEVQDGRWKLFRQFREWVFG